MDPNATITYDPKLVSSASAPNCDLINADCIELNNLSQLGSKNREAYCNFGAEYVLNPDGTNDVYVVIGSVSHMFVNSYTPNIFMLHKEPISLII